MVNPHWGFPLVAVRCAAVALAAKQLVRQAISFYGQLAIGIGYQPARASA